MANATDVFKNVTSDFLSSLSESITMRTIGEKTPYLDVSCVNLFTKDYPFVYDHVLRVYMMGSYFTDDYGCPKFTFYKEKPSVRLADPYQDLTRLVGKWVPDMKFNVTLHGKTMNSYAESDEGVEDQHEFGTVFVNGMSVVSNANPFNDGLSKCDLLYKTNENFRKGRYRTIVARFHTDTADSKDGNNPTQTAISSKYGMSHGRNLLKVTPDNPNGYDNPYCRVWTYHHEYTTYSDAIRPFSDEMDYTTLQKDESTDGGTLSFRTDPVENGANSFDGGSVRLRDFGVLDPVTSRPFIAPTAKLQDYFDKTEDGDRTRISPKRCMFSIENLAWKDNTGINRPNEFDPTGLSPEQKGPFGGRIMWFPPYNLSFNEDFNAQWNPNVFIGRGEPIYTYKNSERTGHLKFTLLIDHPSILDYWEDRDTGKDSSEGASSMMDGGNGLFPNNVDDIKDSENKLLRFFAGCEILKAKNQMYKVATPPEEEEPEEPTIIEEVNEPEKPELKKGLKIVAMLYFPNNYSGVDDGAEKAVDYLMNGVGAQVAINTRGGDKPSYIPVEADKPVNLYDQEGSRINNFGGYEVRADNGVSYVNAPMTSATVAAGTFYQDTNQQYLTAQNGSKFTVQYGDGTTYTLAKMVGSNASKAKPTSSMKKVDFERWLTNRWFYRVDEAWAGSKLNRHPISYIDTNPKQLNGQGYNQVYHNGFAAKMGVGDGKAEDILVVGFTDLYVAAKNDPNVTSVLDGCYNNNNVQLVKEVLKKDGKYKVTAVNVYGHASSNGRVSSNSKLATNRMKTLRGWMNANGFSSNGGEDDIKIQDERNDHVDTYNISDLDQKIWRSAHVEIVYDEVDISSSQITDGNDNIGVVGVATDATRIALKNLEAQNPDAYNNIMSGGKKNESVDDYAEKYYVERYLRGNSDAARLLVTNGQDNGIPNVNGPADDIIDFEPDTSQGSGNPYTISKVPRYDNEGEFFQALSIDHPFIVRKINDKIRYFDPAFHSISPEGFNARLTFLQQCTRQGNTYNAEMGNMAGNMAFGRPPICVLRIGDFWYNKIVIERVSINYGGEKDLQWDLNLEGIGVMPMYADVDISFKFIGGSDLAGPIARLQNAMSFNYYANTSVYDNRAEMVEFNYGEKDGIETKYHTLEEPIGKVSKDIDRKGVKGGKMSNSKDRNSTVGQ